ncbi:hypothetical protein MKX08_004071 [Trichoderma sp. CBMAI-0020]|nr:hypothetical protein MKX08_004071 [Trichoderma sp. CBMAI-0020]
MGLSKTSIQLSCFFFIAAAQAYTTFEPDCSAPTKKVNYVAAPSSRGTLDILLKSVFAIFACTWTIHHPNVPRQYHGYRRKPKSQPDNHDANPDLCSHSDTSWDWRLRALLKSTGRMVLTIFAPEVIIAVAYNDRLAARVDHKALVDQAVKDEISWSWIHTYYANMGGFVVEKKDYTRWTSGEYNMHHLSGRDIFILRKLGYIEKLPNMSKRALKDRAKSDSLIKAISVTQIVWSTARILARTVWRLSICPLELTVLAFSLCAIVIYLLYWEKPKSIGITTSVMPAQPYTYDDIRVVLTLARDEGIYVKAENNMISSSSIESKSAGPKSAGPPSIGICEWTPSHDVNQNASSYILRTWSTMPLFSFRKPTSVDGAPLRIDSVRKGERFDDGTLWALLAGMVLFGSIHIGAWHFEFPTRADRMLWRCSTVYSVGCVFIALVAVSLQKAANKARREHPDGRLGTVLGYCGRFLYFAGLLLYVVARLVILVEMFRTLFYLPPDAYISSRTPYN